jgi:hypothetical protein
VTEDQEPRLPQAGAPIDEDAKRPQEDVRLLVRTRLPSLIQDALTSYDNFSAGAPPEDAKSFLAYQTACRAAVAHLEMLLKLAAFADAPGQGWLNDDEDREIEQLLETARSAVQSYDPDED